MKLAVTIVLLFSLTSIFGQFYNGTQMQFGKNRVQYDEFLWQFIREDEFDVYFTIGGRTVADYVALNSNEYIKEIEKYFGFNYDRRIILIIYNNYTDYLQSNIGLSTSEDQYNVGGTTNIVSNKVCVYFDGNYHTLEKNIKEGIAQLMFNYLMYGTENIREILSNSASGNFPEWYSKGLCLYLSDKWDTDIEDKIKQYIATNKTSFHYRDLKEDDAYVISYAIWKYLDSSEGEGIIGNIIYLTRLSKDIESGFLYILGKDLNTILRESFEYYEKKFSLTEKIKLKNLNSKLELSQAVTSLAIDKNSEFIAYGTNKGGKRSVYFKNIVTNENLRIYKNGNDEKIEHKYKYPIIVWHPTSLILSFVDVVEGQLMFFLYTMETGELISRPLFGISDIHSYSYSDNGLQIVFSGVTEGQSDLFLYNIASRTQERITNDIFTDRNPVFSSNDTEVFFSSNRIEQVDSLLFENFDIYKLNIESKVIIPLLTTPQQNEINLVKTTEYGFSFLSDKEGRYESEDAIYDSSIVSIDTAIHYNYFFRFSTSASYPLNLLNLTGNSKSLWKSVQVKNKYFAGDSLPPFPSSNSFFKKEKIDWYATLNKSNKDTSGIYPTQEIDSIININNYRFEYEKQNRELGIKEYYLGATGVAESRTPSIYRKHFYINQIVNQIDFGFLDASYQSYTGGAVYFSPGLNVFIKLGIIDIFENYRLTGGIRLSGDFNSNEYLFLMENLEKRWDKQIVYHRQSFYNLTENMLYKVVNNEIFYRFNYPFTQVSAIRFSGTARYDRNVPLTIYPSALLEPVGNEVRVGLKAEYVFDNTRNIILNIYKGTRAKLFTEYFQKIDNTYSNLFVFGADYRNYIHISRGIIWANRFACSYSTGSDKLIYYLGSVDNWINIFSSYERYNTLTQFDRSKNWVYHTLATNMRGYNQNARNGTSFALLNSEIRIPFVYYLADKPIGSDFMKNLQFVAFADLGSAWSGLIPDYKNENYNSYFIPEPNGTNENVPVRVKIEQELSPIIAGYGYGLRTRLFGYFVRADWAWGFDSGVVKPKIFYLSLSLDF